MLKQRLALANLCRFMLAEAIILVGLVKQQIKLGLAWETQTAMWKG